MFEHHKKPLISQTQFVRRLFANVLIAMMVVAVSLFIGMVGYHITAGLSWIDSLQNASMILTGMGPVNPMEGNSAKFFASAYAIYSGVAFLSAMAVIVAPVIHRFMHKFHLEEEE